MPILTNGLHTQNSANTNKAIVDPEGFITEEELRYWRSKPNSVTYADVRDRLLEFSAKIDEPEAMFDPYEMSVVCGVSESLLTELAVTEFVDAAFSCDSPYFMLTDLIELASDWADRGFVVGAVVGEPKTIPTADMLEDLHCSLDTPCLCASCHCWRCGKAAKTYADSANRIKQFAVNHGRLDIYLPIDQLSLISGIPVARLNGLRDLEYLTVHPQDPRFVGMRELLTRAQIASGFRLDVCADFTLGQSNN